MTGIALCHTVPRDNLMRFCVILLVGCFILQAVAIARRHQLGSGGTYIPRAAAGQLLYLNADMSLVWQNGTTQCTNDSNDAPCLNYVEQLRAVDSLILTAFVSTPIAMAVIMAGIVQLSSTTTAMVVGFWVSIWLPFLTTLIGTCLFFTSVVSSTATSAGIVEPYDFEYGVSINLVIASCALHCFGFVFASVRLILALLLRPSMKRQMIQSKNIDSIMTLHMVNDDWERQKKVWSEHQREVEAMVEKEEQYRHMPSAFDAHEPIRVPVDDEAESTLTASVVLANTVSSMAASMQADMAGAAPSSA